LIHGRGREIGPEIAPPPAMSQTLPEDAVHPDAKEGSEN
jgi:hypothetical protein